MAHGSRENGLQALTGGLAICGYLDYFFYRYGPFIASFSGALAGGQWRTRKGATSNGTERREQSDPAREPGE